MPFFSLSFICSVSAYLLFQTNFFPITKYCFLLRLLSLKYFCWAVWLHSSVQTTKYNFQNCSPQVLQFAREIIKALPCQQQECCLCSRGSTGYMGRILAHCCTALVGAETLLRAKGTEKGTENIPLL